MSTDTAWFFRFTTAVKVVGTLQNTGARASVVKAPFIGFLVKFKYRD